MAVTLAPFKQAPICARKSLMSRPGRAESLFPAQISCDLLLHSVTIRAPFEGWACGRDIYRRLLRSFTASLLETVPQFGAVVQLVRIPACHAGGRGFES